MELEIKLVGDKLRTLRKELGLNQEDLVKHKINTSTKDTPFTRNLVSMVETDKSPLTKKLAETIHKNILIACDELGIEATFNFQEICLTPEEQTLRYISDYKNTLCNSLSLSESISYANKLIVLAEEYRLLSDLCNLYIVLGDLCSDKNLKLSLKYYSNAYVLKSELSEEDSIAVSRKLKNINIRLGEYEDALNITYPVNNDNIDLLIPCMFNDILALKKLHRFDQAIEKINKLNPLLKSDHKSIQLNLKILEANIQILRNNYPIALKIFKSLEKRSTSAEATFLIKYNQMVLKNKADVCTEEDLQKFSEYEFPKSLEISDKINYYRELSSGYDKFNMKKSVDYLNVALNEILNLNDISGINKKSFNIILNNLLDNPAKMEYFLEETSEDFKLLIVSSIQKNIIDENTIFKTLLYFQEKNDYKFVNSLIEKKIS